MNKLLYWRSKRAMSIQELADKSGVNRATINRIEHGRVRPSGKTIGLLANVLEIDVSELTELATMPVGELRATAAA